MGHLMLEGTLLMSNASGVAPSCNAGSKAPHNAKSLFNLREKRIAGAFTAEDESAG